MSSTLRIKATTCDDAISGLLQARRYNKRNRNSMDCVPSLYGSGFLGTSFRPHLSLSAMKTIIRAYYNSTRYWQDLDYKEAVLITEIECYNFGISISFTEHKVTKDEEE